MDAVVDALGPDVYITIDLDGLEPGLMPGVGTPEPGGLTWRELTTLLRKTFERRNVVACDVVELCPLRGLYPAERQSRYEGGHRDALALDQGKRVGRLRAIGEDDLPALLEDGLDTGRREGKVVRNG